MYESTVPQGNYFGIASIRNIAYFEPLDRAGCGGSFRGPVSAVGPRSLCRCIAALNSSCFFFVPVNPLPLTMPGNRATRVYFLLLMLNVSAGSFFLLLILNATHPVFSTDATRGDSIVITIVSVVWPPLSVAISLVLLKQWANTTSEPPTPLLPTLNSTKKSTDVDILRNKIMVPVAFLHMLFMLNHLFARAYHLYAGSESIKYLPTYIADVSRECKPLSSILMSSDTASCIPAYWGTIGIPWILVSIIIFGQCLNTIDINTNHWGYFHLLYQFVIFLLEATTNVVGAFMNLFHAIQESFQYFQITWASQSGLVVEGTAHQSVVLNN